MVGICDIWAESIVLFWYKSNNNVELSMTYKTVDVVNALNKSICHVKELTLVK